MTKKELRGPLLNRIMYRKLYGLFGMGGITVSELIGQLCALLGSDRVLTDSEAVGRRTLDTWPLRLAQQVAGAEASPPLCVIRPQSTAEVASALELLYARAVAVVPFGGGSGVSGGAQARPEAVTLDLGALDQILELDEQNLTVTAQAGVRLGRLESWLAERGYTTGHYPQSIDLAQLGGLVATRSAGQFSTRYGNIEELLAGLEAVLPDGRVVRLQHQPRRSAGPDLRQLWLGSEGAFGVVTEVTMKLFPLPADRWMQAYAVPSMRLGLELVRRFMREGWRPAVVRLHDEIEAQRMLPGAVTETESVLLLLSEGPSGYAQTEGAALHRMVAEGGARALGPEPVERWLAHRNDVHEFDKYIKMGVLVDTIEVAAGWTRIADIYEQVTARLRAEVPELALVSGHSSHSYPQGTNLYFIWGALPARDPADVERVYGSVWSRVMETTLALGGTICHHHGIGQLRAPWMPAELGSAYPLLQALKQTLDPKGLMNPGTLLPLPGQRPPG